jgi:hypothetical protein
MFLQLSLFRLFFLLEQESILNFLLFFLSLLSHYEIGLRYLSLLLLLQLLIEYFLLDFLFVPLLLIVYVIRLLPRLFYFLPRLHLFLL